MAARLSPRRQCSDGAAAAIGAGRARSASRCRWARARRSARARVPFGCGVPVGAAPWLPGDGRARAPGEGVAPAPGAAVPPGAWGRSAWAPSTGAWPSRPSAGRGRLGRQRRRPGLLLGLRPPCSRVRLRRRPSSTGWLIVRAGRAGRRTATASGAADARARGRRRGAAWRPRAARVVLELVDLDRAARGQRGGADDGGDLAGRRGGERAAGGGRGDPAAARGRAAAAAPPPPRPRLAAIEPNRPAGTGVSAANERRMPRRPCGSRGSRRTSACAGGRGRTPSRRGRRRPSGRRGSRSSRRRAPRRPRRGRPARGRAAT